MKELLEKELLFQKILHDEGTVIIDSTSKMICSVNKCLKDGGKKPQISYADTICVNTKEKNLRLTWVVVSIVSISIFSVQ